LEFKLVIKVLLTHNFVIQQTYYYVKDGVSESATLTNKVYNI